MNLRTLEATNETVVKTWLRTYLTQHLAWWAVAYGTAPRHTLEDLVSREWNDLFTASRAPEHFTCVAEDAHPLGVAYARLRQDRYMGITVGVLSWLYVTEEVRGQGVSSLLMEASDTGWKRKKF